jgi:hypothetical protein
MLISGSGMGDTVEDVLRAVGAVLDERHARGVALIEVPEGLVIRARVAADADHRGDDPWVPIEQAFGEGELLEQRLAAIARRGTGHQAGPIERALRILGRYIDHYDLTGITLMEHGEGRGWMLWHKSRTAGRHALVTFAQEELERAAEAARQARVREQTIPGPPPDPELMELPAAV